MWQPSIRIRKVAMVGLKGRARICLIRDADDGQWYSVQVLPVQVLQMPLGIGQAGLASHLTSLNSIQVGGEPCLP